MQIPFLMPRSQNPVKCTCAYLQIQTCFVKRLNISLNGINTNSSNFTQYLCYVAY